MKPDMTALAKTVRQALTEQANPPAAIVAAREQFEELDRLLADHNQAVVRAVDAYNAARRQLVQAWARENELGWCSVKDHFAPATELEGLIVTGAYVTSGYYEYLRDFQQRKIVCRSCRHLLKPGPGRYEGEFRQYATHELADPYGSLRELPADQYRLQQLAKIADITLPPVMSLDRYGVVQRGDEVLTADPDGSTVAG